MKKVLVTGGLGQLGAYIYRQLKDSYKLIILDNESNSKVVAPKEATFIKGDITKDETLLRLNDSSIDIIIHAAAQISVTKSIDQPSFDANNNIMGTLNILDFARRKDVEKVVYISSAATYGNPQFLPITEDHPRKPLSPYGLSKLVGEQYTSMYHELYGLNTTSLILFNLYSSLQKKNDPYAGVIYKFISQIKSGLPPTVEGDGLQTRDFIHTSDVSYAIELVLQSDKSKGETYNIGSGKAVSVLDLANNLIDISKKELDIKFVSPRKGDIKESYCSIEKAKKELGFEPKLSLQKGLKEVYDNIVL